VFEIVIENSIPANLEIEKSLDENRKL